MDNIKIYYNIINYLISSNWKRINGNNKYDQFVPSKELAMEPDFLLYIPKQTDKVDFLKNIERMIYIISDIQDDNSDDLYELIIENKQILNIHLEEKDIENGKPSIPRFNDIMQKIEELLADTASFTILQKPHFFTQIEEAERYVNLCRFIKNEKGSLITKVELPNEEEIKESNLFEEGIKGYVINNKLFDIFDYINNKILIEEYQEPSDEELISNKEVISVNVSEKIKEFYQTVDLTDINIVLKRIDTPRRMEVTGLTKNKINNLKSFSQTVKNRINEILDIPISGKIIELSSKNVEGDKNQIKVSSSIKNVKSTITASLNSVDYQKAIKAHGDNKTVIIKGIFEKEKTQYKVTELQEFKIDNA